MLLYLEVLKSQELPGSLMVRTWHLLCQGLCFVPGERNKILKPSGEAKKKKKKVKISKVQQKFYTPLFSIYAIKKKHKT